MHKVNVSFLLLLAALSQQGFTPSIKYTLSSEIYTTSLVLARRPGRAHRRQEITSRKNSSCKAVKNTIRLRPSSACLCRLVLCSINHEALTQMARLLIMMILTGFIDTAMLFGAAILVAATAQSGAGGYVAFTC